jgi:hypothetical protein
MFVASIDTVDKFHQDIWYCNASIRERDHLELKYE